MILTLSIMWACSVETSNFEWEMHLFESKTTAERRLFDYYGCSRFWGNPKLI
jgi:hypothetical protein